MDRKEIEKIRQWVKMHKDEIRNDLKQLVAIRSVAEKDDCKKDGYPYGKGCAEVLETMLEFGNKYDMKVENYNGYCGSISLKKRMEGLPEIGIWTHLDVVDEGEGWHFPPYDLTEQEGFWIGRGVQDNKGPAVGVLWALRYLKENNSIRKYNYCLFTGCSEEKGMEDAAYFKKHERLSEIQLVADGVFPVGYGEKGIMNLKFYKKMSLSCALREITAGSSVNSIPAEASAVLILEEKEQQLLKEYAGKNQKISIKEEGGKITVTAAGISGHVGFPEKCENALFVLVDFLKKVPWKREKQEEELLNFLYGINRDFYGGNTGIACSDDCSGKLCGALTTVSADSDGIIMRADYRYPIFAGDSTQIRKQLERYAGDFRVTMETERISEPYYRDPESKKIRQIMGIYRDVSGNHKAQPYTMGGGTYARMFPNAIVYGMSLENKIIYRAKTEKSGDCHQPDESVNIEQLLEGIVIYIATLLELDKRLEVEDE